MKKNKRLISVLLAKKKMIASIEGFKNPSELIDFRNSENRVLAEKILSKHNIPEFDNSAVDGFGINYNSIEKLCKLEDGFTFTQVESKKRLLMKNCLVNSKL